MRRSRANPALVLPILLAAPHVAQADGLIDEVRVGVYDHDIAFLGDHKETGADIGLELLFPSPALLEAIGSPRPVIGGLINTSGETDQAYIGLTWTWDLAEGVFNPDDAVYIEGTLGGGWNDGYTSISDNDPALQRVRAQLGSNILFREDVDIGYHFTSAWSIAVSYNHISNADLETRNAGLNDVGVRLGYKF